jgi:hypothetical protein
MNSATDQIVASGFLYRFYVPQEHKKSTTARLKLDDSGKSHFACSADKSKVGSTKIKCHNETATKIFSTCFDSGGVLNHKDS